MLSNNSSNNITFHKIKQKKRRNNCVNLEEIIDNFTATTK